MTPGPNQILKTPLTGAIVKITTIMSGNTFGARYWTDGKCEAPMLPDRPWLRLVPNNGELFWTDECEQIGEEELRDGVNEFANVPFAEEPSIDDYIRALSDSIASSLEKERYVRIRLWWAANDPVRQGETTSPPWAGHRDNQINLLALLDELESNQRLMAAEVCRELGDFARASELLTFGFPKDYHPAVNRLKTLVEQRDSIVRKLS